MLKGLSLIPRTGADSEGSFSQFLFAPVRVICGQLEFAYVARIFIESTSPERPSTAKDLNSRFGGAPLTWTGGTTG
jgi:hypothetical protein